MLQFKMIKNILWDFDGVILDSMKVRDWGFEEIFKSYPNQDVTKLLKFHRENGGLSRYVKIRYFYEVVLGKAISDEEVLVYASNFSNLMRVELINPNNLIKETKDYISDNYKNFNFHIVSGSDQMELRFLCDKLNISTYFKSIQGSPTPKKELVKNLMVDMNYSKNNTCLIGDSINDYEAADFNGISFFGFNNPLIKNLGVAYIEKLSNFKIR